MSFIEPGLLDSGAFTFSRYVDDSERLLDLEERALTNYLNEVKGVSAHGFVYSPSIHPIQINMFANPNYYIGQAANRCH